MRTLEQNLVTLAAKDTWVLDFDGLMYRRDSAFSRALYPRVAANFNQMASEDPAILEALKQELQTGLRLGENLKEITAQDLKAVYPPLVRVLIKRAGQASVAPHLERLYGTDYTQIEPDLRLVEAFKLARAKGINIFFNSNGVSGKNPSENLHLQCSMRALGFNEDMLTYMSLHTFDIINAVKAGRQKDDPVSFTEDFFEFAGIQNPGRVLMGDDGIPNLEAASQAGIQDVLWTWTTEDEPKPDEAAKANSIGAVYVRNTGEALLQIAEAHI